MNSLIEIDNKLKEMYMRAKKDNCVYCVYKGGYKNLFDKYCKMATPMEYNVYRPFYCAQHIMKAFK